MYDSLDKHCTDFHLYVFAFDDECYQFLASLQLKNLTAISLKQFEDEELLRVKPSRSDAEYCWTSTSSTILFCLKNFNIDDCTYIDADMLFYSNPKVLIDEMNNKSVLITEHRYTKEYDQSATSGRYCVQFMTFKNDAAGLKVLNWWRNACIEWCYNRVEDGKFGDQKYLDDWTTRFNGVHELANLGGGLAPWNVQQYQFEIISNNISLNEISSTKKFDAVFFHFHGTKFFSDKIVSFTSSNYTLSDTVQQLFYKPYIKLLLAKQSEIEQINKRLNSNGATAKSPVQPISAKVILIYYLKDLKQSIANIFGKKLKKRIAHHYYFYLDDFK
jgi:hypothetical protein